MLISRIIEGKRTTDFKPLHIITRVITSFTLYLSYIYTWSHFDFQKFRWWYFMECL